MDTLLRHLSMIVGSGFLLGAMQLTHAQGYSGLALFDLVCGIWLYLGSTLVQPSD
jgi:hypothetical protein